MIWSERHGRELYIYHDGVVIYKRWLNEDGSKRQPSMLFNEVWPNVRIAMQKDEPKYEPTEDAPSKEDFEKEYDDDKEAFKERWLPKDPEPSQN